MKMYLLSEMVVIFQPVMLLFLFWGGISFGAIFRKKNIQQTTILLMDIQPNQVG